MKKYYIFAINREYYEIYKKNKRVLYNTLKNLYELDLDAINYGLSIYNQLCVPINTDILENYYQDYKYLENRFLINDSIVEINKSCIIVVTKSTLNHTLRHLYYYNYPLFACNFRTNEYFFLTNEYFKKATNILK